MRSCRPLPTSISFSIGLYYFDGIELTHDLASHRCVARATTGPHRVITLVYVEHSVWDCDLLERWIYYFQSLPESCPICSSFRVGNRTPGHRRLGINNQAQSTNLSTSESTRLCGRLISIYGLPIGLMLGSQ